jgi:hypothetical protein
MTSLGRTRDLPFSEASLDIIRDSHKAFDQLDRQAEKSWEYYKRAGAGFILIRQLAMREAGTNRPFGRLYTAAYAKLLAASKLDERVKDKADRQKLLMVMDNVDAIEEWRKKQDPEGKRWTHPSTIWKKWQASQVPPRKYEGKAPAVKEITEEALTDKVANLRTENSRLKIEAGKRCDVDLMHSDDADLEQWLRSRILSEHRARRLRDLLIELYPLPLPRVPVTHPDGATDDDVMG